MTVVTPDAVDEAPLSIGEVAAAFDLPISTLRYYDSINLVPASHRRGRVRYYDHADLRRLAYVQLWHGAGALSIERTHAIVASTDQVRRNEVIERSRQDLVSLITKLTEAEKMLGHLTICRWDHHTDCPIVSGYLDERVQTALTGSPHSSPEESVFSAMHRVKANLHGGEPPTAVDSPPERRRQPEGADRGPSQGPSRGPRDAR